MKEELISFCNSINIEYVGIAPPGPYYDFEKVWRRQIERGHISGLEEKDFERRIYPSLTLEDVESIIVCLFPYYTGNAEGANLSKYAYGMDYHIIVKEKLEAIGRFLDRRIEGFHYKAFVDAGPLSDRYLAYKAGLGFWGINNHIITDKYGSYVFIGYILNNYPFEADRPQGRTCLKCFNCVRSCPGQCILGDFTIDPLRCKSYITQKKEELNDEDIGILKKHRLVWGCDVCQDVCPHNQKVEKTIMEEFKKNLIYSVDCEELSRISNKEFIRRYGNRAFGWRGRKVLLRSCKILRE
ncbi:tRNA epoxyqueuosine(34) reductase QueG [Lutispora sp.]|uniref:tRNA epoxyqueuosine(34) reductase QueG n=1 Tax=Lutispora sp. TaxID=2828727 RepID=UPI002B1F7B7A|nr:tRNA epoxyqueuosine(34) reductase QueG [Lutispora sp.]MEA4962940.1 tRNA epoxyqueuosine(34) reductase QueG [Lutispora sp.]